MIFDLIDFSISMILISLWWFMPENWLPLLIIYFIKMIISHCVYHKLVRLKPIQELWPNQGMAPTESGS